MIRTFPAVHPTSDGKGAGVRHGGCRASPGRCSYAIQARCPARHMLPKTPGSAQSSHACPQHPRGVCGFARHRCGRRVLGAVQAGVGIAFWTISTPAARSTGSSAGKRPPRMPQERRSDVGSTCSIPRNTGPNRNSRRDLRPAPCSGIAHGRPLQREPMRLMDHAVADRIGDTGLPNRGVPRRRGKLARD